ncbi:hypothetical protein [Faecalibacter rhinopitheci]|uniref:Uncharacterized protein n=1 Tax=Faecalibacter rhinopitheci TaxID=2779678 RepID=A0A8J7FUG4_9FLAO|nr:hypothetical protein [Faecalibacter rhinopitheci]MBF0598017.1 hypothetical protein [Faecalibacter rhinopitheci]
MNKVSDKEEILDNVEVFLEGLELGTDNEKEIGLQLIKTSQVFLVIQSEDINIFVPSSFIGYVDQNFEVFDSKIHTEETVIDSISQALGSTPKIDKTMDELFLDFCDELAINRNDVGISREYWIIKSF